MPSVDYLEILSHDKARRLRVPLRTETERPRGFHDDKRMVFWGYDETGALFSVQDTERGKALYPPKVIDPRPGRYDELRVYFIQAASGQIKIGIAADPTARLRDLQVGSPVPLALVCDCGGGRPQEREYHRRFAAYRVHGEWFEPSAEIIAEIEAVKCR